MKKSESGCIDGDKVPCDKAREYLGKKGLLCSVTGDKKQGEKSPKKRKKKTFFDKVADLFL
jgi:hypothetical protein